MASLPTLPQTLTFLGIAAASASAVAIYLNRTLDRLSRETAEAIMYNASPAPVQPLPGVPGQRRARLSR